MEERSENRSGIYLTCERKSVYILMMLAAGMMGAYTYNMRGGVFCNAQTANIVLMAVELGKGRWLSGLYYLIPFTAYVAGAFISEFLPGPLARLGLFRWETCLAGIEIIVLFAVGLVPLTVTPRVVQVIINLLASMQYNTFRQAEDMPVATTFCTNHCRLIGVGMADFIRSGDKKSLRRGGFSLTMLVSFFGSGVILTAFCGLLAEKVIWLSLIPLFAAFAFMAYADLTYERDRVKETPLGH